MSGLPRDTVSHCYGDLKCPWCKQDVGAAPMTLGQLHDSHLDDGLTHADRAASGLAGDTALVCDCPSCGKPFAAALQVRRWRDETIREVRLLAVRTAADVRLIGGST